MQLANSIFSCIVYAHLLSPPARLLAVLGQMYSPLLTR